MSSRLPSSTDWENYDYLERGVLEESVSSHLHRFPWATIPLLPPYFAFISLPFGSLFPGCV
ncbi:hypothetical protein K439DRAFT_1627639 [Ramaria rubella]|nr:hypothetical protein K439DRAFT_1627639 [Ramaria rubella]